MKRIFLGLAFGLISASVALAQDAQPNAFRGGDFRTGIVWSEPALVTPGETPKDAPSDAIVLFDGTQESFDANWTGGKWSVADGILTCKPGTGAIYTKEKFGSTQVHFEFACPPVLDENQRSQGRGNSGFFFMNHYELQILDSFENPTYFEGQCGSIYKQFPPYVNPCKKPTEWQTYDVIFTRPILRVEDGKVVEVIRPAYITAILNGCVVQNHWAIEGDTFFHRAPEYQPHADLEPFQIQDHNNTTSFRNIWVRNIPDSNVKPTQSGMNYYN